MTTTTVRPEVLPMPERMRNRPVERGYPVPWFVAQLEDGTYDFRVIRTRGFEEAHAKKLCWICGGHMGAYKAFVIGPMCAVNRVSAELPSHRECAEWAARACPFLARPHMRRRDHDYPDGTQDAAGFMIDRNPGVALVWVTKSYTLRSDHKGHLLVVIGDPVETIWLRQGQPATREEVAASIDSGLPILREAAEKQGAQGVAALQRQIDIAMELLP